MLLTLCRDLYISLRLNYGQDVNSRWVVLISAEDLEDLIEGDIKIDVGPENKHNQEKSEDAIRSRQYTWRTKIIPYEVSKGLGKWLTSC